jgi:hypothetical protein
VTAPGRPHWIPVGLFIRAAGHKFASVGFGLNLQFVELRVPLGHPLLTASNDADGGDPGPARA